MAGGWRVTARMVATAVAARAVTRAAESVRKLLEEAAPRHELTTQPTPPSQLAPVPHLTAATSMPPAPSSDDRVIAAQAGPHHEFGPIPLIAPSHGIGFRSEPRRREPASEMPVISRPYRDEPEDRPDVAPAAPVIMPDSVRTAAAFVQDLDDETADDDEPSGEAAVEAAPEQAAAEPDSKEPESEEPESEPAEAPQAEAVAEEQPAEAPEAEPVPDEPEPTPVRVLRLTDPPYDDEPDPQTSAVDELVEPPDTAPQPEPEPLVEEPQPAPAPDKATEPAKRDKVKNKKKAKGERKGKHRRHTSAVSGTVQSSRGRGLRGMQVTVVDDKERVIGAAVTGAGGAFVVENLPPGSYWLAAADEAEGDFAAGWHGGSTFAKADPVKVKQGKTRCKVGVTLVSVAAIDLDVDVRKKKAVVGIEVTDRGTGAPAEGSVTVTTKLFSAELPLARGRAAMTLLASAKGSAKLSKKVTVDYSGSKHTRPQSASATLR